MVQTGPGNPADCVICSLPGFEQIGTATSHSQHPTTSSDEFAAGIGPNSGAKHGGTSDCLRVVESFNHIAGAQVARVALGCTHNGHCCAVVECWRCAELTGSG
jgi:hypothetical protein